MSENIVILALIGLLVLTQLFWMWTCKSLVNRIMSRDFAEFKRAELTQPSQVRRQMPDNDSDALPPIF